MTSIITVENLGKKYLIRHQQDKYVTLRDVITKKTKNIFSFFHHQPATSSQQPTEEFWALKNVSFEVNQGDRIGIIGRNGAGKTTLLKILSRITEPTKGKVTLRGRIASLLEVGTGFHPELTGRENIYLNGAILGMTRAEIQKKFDEIVAFAEVEKFLDTPVKRYSSGMYVRLAFAVAAHLESEILLVDEVLAVGDAQFQKKCLGKMEDVANKQGRTILFVSHNMAAIQALCSRAIFIQRGKIALDTDVAKATQSYSDSMQEESVPLLSNERNRDGNGTFRFKSVQIKDAESNSLNVVRCGRDVDVILEYESRDNQPLKYVQFAIGFHSLLGQFLFMCTTDLMNMDFPILPPKGQVVCRIPFFPLSPGRYGFNFNGSANGILADWVKDLLCFSVIEDDFFGSGKLPPQTHGGFLVRHSWMEGPASLSP